MQEWKRIVERKGSGVVTFYINVNDSELFIMADGF